MKPRLIAAALLALMASACATEAPRSDELTIGAPPGNRPVSKCKIPCNISPGPNCC